MKVGSLFSGYGGLDMAVGGELAWYSEIEPAACKVMEVHHPGVLNIGDVTQVDWKSVDRVDVLTGGYPCQPFSTAGQRKGAEDERHLWPYVRDAISVLEPGLAVLENVAGHLSLGLGTVLGELSEVGYSARWGVVRASDAGACHQRARVFIVAYPASAEWGEQKSKYLVEGGWSAESGERVSALAYPNSVTDGSGVHGGTTSGTQLESVTSGYVRCNVEPVAGSEVFENENGVAFGPYAQAVRRWERVLGRAAPTPIVNVKGQDKLNPVFVEWMMGLPEGWVTGHGLSASQELKMLGNGVVPQQARLALELL
jgi:DNA (cytosine-5)-methyltransferase 1